MTLSNVSMPDYVALMGATLEALASRGGSASVQELLEDVPTIMNLSEEVLEVPLGNSSQPEFQYRASWARTFLKEMTAVENSSRGVWSLTAEGRSLLSLPEDVAREKLSEGRRKANRESRRRRSASDLPADPTSEPAGDDRQQDAMLPYSHKEDASGDEWKTELLAALQKMAPDAFERLCQRILRESAFTEVEVTGRSGDGGIDGVGVLRVNLISFHVVFQCKRYQGSVGSGQIRDFRGAMIGRADKGLFLTTGRFSSSAKQEAIRAGAPAIDLIDGNELCDLLKKLDLGVRTKRVEVEEVIVDREFLESI